MICFVSESSDGIPVDYYKVAVSDITGQEIFFESTSSNCIRIEDNLVFEHKTCAPYNVSVRALNSMGSSTPSVVSSQITAESNICSCYHDKG